MTTTTNTIRWDQDSDGIVVLTLDDPNQSANTMNADYVASMRSAVDRLVAEKDDIRGVVITSAKRTFFAGGDLDDLYAAGPGQAQELYTTVTEIKAQLRTLETLGRPVVAAINGAALGGGFEIALAAQHRIVADVPGAQVGLPEVTLGLLPGGGGVVRTVRMLGLLKAVSAVLGEGRRFRPADALDIGLIDEVVPTVEDLLPAAKAWVEAHSEAVQPWDVKGYRIPGGTPSTPALAATLPALPALLRQRLRGANYPAPRAILAAAVEGTQVDFDTALDIESRYLVSLVTGQISKNMTKAFFFDLGKVKSGASRPEGFPAHRAKKVAVLGAGMMGAGIAYVCAKAGLDVVLKDLSVPAAEHGKAHSASLVDQAVARGRMSRTEADALLARITPTAQATAAAGVDLVIEAVFESVPTKHQVFSEIEGLVSPDAVLGSNTSTLPITTLAQGVQRPENFVGLHFFSPVDKMPLLEIVTGAKTSPQTLAKAFDIARQIGKIPIVVNDHRGFFTSRVIGTFLDEAIAMVGEGVPAASVEQAGLQAGYPTAPLQLADELNLSLMSKIQKETKAGLEADPAGRSYEHHAAYDVIDALIAQGRTGRLGGAGFYDYEGGTRARLWPGLAQQYGTSTQLPMRDMQERMLFAEALETVRCLDEGVLRTVEDANIGSILGIGFPGWTGGVVQYAEGYPGGIAGFVARARELAERYGDRFRPPASLVARADEASGEPSA